MWREIDESCPIHEMPSSNESVKVSSSSDDDDEANEVKVYIVTFLIDVCIYFLLNLLLIMFR